MVYEFLAILSLEMPIKTLGLSKTQHFGTVEHNFHPLSYGNFFFFNQTGFRQPNI